MARSISIAKSSTTIYVLVVANMSNMQSTKIGDNDIAYTDMFTATGNVSLARAQKKAEIYFKDRNVMAVAVSVNDTSDSKLTLNFDVFVAHSVPCKEGESYGRDYITRDCQATVATVMYMQDGAPVSSQLAFPDVTTPSKLLNWCREATNSTCIVLTSEIRTEKRFMSVERFTELAMSTK